MNDIDECSGELRELLKSKIKKGNKMTNMFALAGCEPNVHYLKVECEFYTPLSMHLKNFEVRKNDRNYQVNDILIFREWSADIEAYTGFVLCAQISYILDDPRYCKEGYVVLGLKFIEP